MFHGWLKWCSLLHLRSSQRCPCIRKGHSHRFVSGLHTPPLKHTSLLQLTEVNNPFNRNVCDHASVCSEKLTWRRLGGYGWCRLSWLGWLGRLGRLGRLSRLGWLSWLGWLSRLGRLSRLSWNRCGRLRRNCRRCKLVAECSGESGCTDALTVQALRSVEARVERAVN